MPVLDSLKSYFHRVHERFKSRREGRTRTVFTIVHDTNAATISSLTIANASSETTVRWKDVIRVDVFKRDLFTVDLICLVFVLSDGTEVETDEEMEGWASLAEKLPEYLPGCLSFEQWFTTVAIPAFELNLATIFQKNPSNV